MQTRKFFVDKLATLYYHYGMDLKKELKPLDVSIDSRSAVPVYEQVKQAIKLLIISGYLEEGDRLVPIREFAGKLRINPNTIVKVYYQLDVEGYIFSQPGSGYFVKANRTNDPEESEQLLKAITQDYIAKALKLGYSIKDLIGHLENKTGSGSQKNVTAKA